MPEKKKLRKAKKDKSPSKVDAFVDAVASALGSDFVHKANESDLGEPRMFIPSGVPELDEVLDRGKRGWPVGRIVEIYGAEATCKTGIGYSLIAEAQKLGGDAVLFSASEGNFDEWLAAQYGIDLDRLIVVDDPTVEGVFSAFDKLLDVVGQDGLLVAVVDSVASLTTKDELEDESFNQDRAIQHRALLLSKALRKIGAKIPKTNAILFCINQVRDNTDPTMAKAKPPGGRALKFYASIRLRLEFPQGSKVRRQKGGKKFVAGFKVLITAEKNRLAHPYQSATIIIDFHEGLRSATTSKKSEDADD